jgi:NTE family protein
MLARFLAAFAALALSGCGGWHYTVNAPLERADAAHGYRFTNVAHEAEADELFIAVTFSGGGMRAAALAYGVLERLAAERIGWRGQERRLLDEVDLINSVSGGSMTAAYYALHGDAIFTDFAPRFFGKDLQDQLESRIVAIGSIPALMSPRYGRIDMVQEFLDETLYDGKTFADIPRRRPYVIISASDMAYGSRFEFTQDFFDLLCSDLDKLPLSRAVAASSAMPLLFSPVTLWNYAGTCSLPPLPVFETAQGALAARQAQRAREVLSYLDRDQRPYIHLLDGGLADNIGIRGLIESAALAGSMDAALRVARVKPPKKVAIIMVNAETEGDRSVDRSADVPTFGQVLRALIDVPINRYSYETQVLGRQSAEAWQQRLQQGGQAIELYLVEVSLNALADPAEREFMNSVPTSLQLPAKTVQRVRRAAAQLLDSSPDFRRLLDSLR